MIALTFSFGEEHPQNQTLLQIRTSMAAEDHERVFKRLLSRSVRAVDSQRKSARGPPERSSRWNGILQGRSRASIHLRAGASLRAELRYGRQPPVKAQPVVMNKSECRP